MSRNCDSLFEVLKEVEEKTKNIRNILKVDEDKSMVAFRGEPIDYEDTKLLPSLYRKKLSLKQEMKLFELLKDYNVIGEVEKTNLQKAMASQHYLATSRLLDITFNVLIAIYFATSFKENEKENQDGYLYIFCLPQHFSPSSKYIEKYYDNMLSGNKSNFILKRNFKVITHGYFNERIKLQRGGFIFFPASNVTRIPKCFYEIIKINGKSKKYIRKQLKEFFSIYESSIFPEKDKTSEVILEGVDRKIEDISTENSINFEQNIYFENLKYEVDYLLHNKKDKKEIMRRLRKYEYDFNISLEEIGQELFKSNILRNAKESAKHDFDNLNIYVKGSKACI